MTPREISDKFFADPEWQVVEALVQSYVDELKTLDTLDVSLPTEQLAAEVRARRIAVEQLTKFLEGARILSRRAEPPSPAPFR